jgi:ABC-type antimicrobial peptide transport system permease subunit
VISSSLAARLWPDRDPIGEQISFYHSASPDFRLWKEVIGIVSDVRLPLSDGATRPWVYAPLTANGRYLLTHSGGDISGALKRLEATVRSADPELVVQERASMASVIDSQRYSRRLAAVMLTVASLITGLIACSGLYSLVSYAAVRRIPEFGLCVALGASRAQIARLVLREGVSLSVGGVVAGVAISALAAAIAASLVPNLPRVGGGALAVITAVMLAIVTVACYGPARRASKVDPLISLRHL